MSETVSPLIVGGIGAVLVSLIPTLVLAKPLSKLIIKVLKPSATSSAVTE